MIDFVVGVVASQITLTLMLLAVAALWRVALRYPGAARALDSSLELIFLRGWRLGVVVFVLAVGVLWMVSTAAAQGHKALLPFTPQQTCNQAAPGVVNGGFEAALDGWTVGMGQPVIRTDRPETGARSLFLGGRNDANDSVSQTVTVPTWAERAALYAFTYTSSDDFPTAYRDGLVVVVLEPSRGIVLAAHLEGNNTDRDRWLGHHVAMDVRAYQGRTLVVSLTGNTDSAFPTKWYADGVSLLFACGSFSP